VFTTIALTVLISSFGCSSVKFHVDNGPIKAHTFSFVRVGPGQASSDQKIKAIHAAFQDAITRSLAAKGLSKQPTGGEVTVAYLIVGGNNVSTTSFNDYFGYSSDANALVDMIHKQQAVNDQSRNYFQAGTLIVDLVDPGTGKLLWRNSMERDILRNVTPEVRAERIQEVTDSVFQPLQVAQ
jgi:hypothetical protein